VRTFPKSLATFRKIINERGEKLRKLTQEELKNLAAEPPEELIVDSRPSTIGIIVQAKPDGNLRVVIQGFMKARFIPGKHVALDGFYKHPDGTVSTMPNEEFYEFD
jgi:5-formyltetrahydrofolate cyclo-ligase